MISQAMHKRKTKAARERKRAAKNVIYRAHNIERGINPKSYYRAQAQKEESGS